MLHKQLGTQWFILYINLNQGNKSALLGHWPEPRDGRMEAGRDPLN